MKSKNITFLPWLDHLRCYGAILVVLYHGMQVIWHEKGYIQNISSTYLSFSNNLFINLIFHGHTAVALFMVVSGFVLTLGLYKKNIYYFKFIFNRILRIYPLFLFIALVLAYVQHQDINIITFLKTAFTFGLAKNTFFVPVAWILAIEFQFYLFYPFLLAGLNRKGIKFLVSIILFFILLRFFSGGDLQYIAYRTIFGRIDQFLMGMILGVIYVDKIITLSNRKYNYLFVFSCLLIIFSLYFFNKFGGLPSNAQWKILWPTYEGIMWAFFVFSYSNMSKYVSNAASHILESIGGISFSILLVHYSVIQALVKHNWLIMFVDKDLILNTFLNTVLIALPITLLISYITNFLIEKPFFKLRINYKK